MMMTKREGTLLKKKMIMTIMEILLIWKNWNIYYYYYINYYYI